MFYYVYLFLLYYIVFIAYVYIYLPMCICPHAIAINTDRTSALISNYVAHTPCRSTTSAGISSQCSPLDGRCCYCCYHCCIYHLTRLLLLLLFLLFGCKRVIIKHIDEFFCLWHIPTLMIRTLTLTSALVCMYALKCQEYMYIFINVYVSWNIYL